jgi:hypothetical protein
MGDLLGSPRVASLFSVHTLFNCCLLLPNFFGAPYFFRAATSGCVTPLWTPSGRGYRWPTSASTAIGRPWRIQWATSPLQDPFDETAITFAYKLRLRCSFFLFRVKLNFTFGAQWLRRLPTNYRGQIPSFCHLTQRLNFIHPVRMRKSS